MGVSLTSLRATRRALASRSRRDRFGALGQNDDVVGEREQKLLGALAQPVEQPLRAEQPHLDPLFGPEPAHVEDEARIEEQLQAATDDPRDIATRVDDVDRARAGHPHRREGADSDVQYRAEDASAVVAERSATRCLSPRVVREGAASERLSSRSEDFSKETMRARRPSSRDRLDVRENLGATHGLEQAVIGDDEHFNGGLWGVLSRVVFGTYVCHQMRLGNTGEHA